MIGASSSGVRCCGWPALMFRMTVARSPGSSSWAAKATVAAPQSTTTAEAALSATVRARARQRTGATVLAESGPLRETGLLSEVRVIERRPPLCVLLPHALQLRADGKRAEPVVKPDRQRAVGDVVL